MSQTQPIDTAYFLTRQIANLQEDFGREIKNGASLFLLYGDEGVGKTRLLEELVSTRFNGLRTHWVDCKESVDEANVPTKLGFELEHTMDNASIGDIILADHFELATNKIKHKLLQSWSTDGIDKDFSLIIATGLAGLKEVRDLAARYRVNVKSFQLLPLTRVEIDDYCANTLFPLLPSGPLLMPKQIRLALNETQGVISKVRDVVEQQGSHITRQEAPITAPIIKPPLVVFGLAIMLVLVGLTYHFMPVASVELLLLNQQGRERFELALPTNNLNAGVSVLEMEQFQTPLIQEPKVVTQAPVIVELAIALPAIALPAIAESRIVAETTVSPLTKPEAFSETQLSKIARLQTEIRQMTVDYAKRPRSITLTAATKKAVEASYLATWVKKIEHTGNLNYPSEARVKKIDGQLRLSVRINQQGAILDVKITKSSGSSILDEAAKRILRLSEPFAPFSEELKQRADQIVIIRTWNFNSNHLITNGEVS
jgi:protein TonB